MSKQAFWHCPCGQANQLSFSECPYCHRKQRDNPRRGRKPCDHASAKDQENVKICPCGAVHFADATSGPEGRWRYITRHNRIKGTVTGFVVTSPNPPYVYADSASASKTGARDKFMTHSRNKASWEAWKEKGYKVSSMKIEVQ